MTTILHLENRIWTESEYLAIGETPERIELFDGSLHVSPSPLPIHQYISARLARTLSPPAEEQGMFALEAINLRAGLTRITIPDLVVTKNIDLWELVVDSSDVLLVCEILSPSNAATDRVLKMHYYAQGGIPWYLLVDPRTGTLRLQRLEGDKYLEHATGAPGKPLALTEPVAVTVDPADLLPPR
ncbi:MAG TPA: Uma2 family endonuclease [Actinoplanes sp.]|nr:Uma2 family endonuclease [Actinoplanes sp.]